MKNLPFTILLCSFCVFISCDKQDEVDISPDGLTSCKEGYSCTYSFFNNAALETGGPVKKGIYNVFQSKSEKVGITDLLDIEVRSTGSSFSMGKNEITNGQVKPRVICTACEYIVLKPVDGLITGRKISDTKWLLDISVVMAIPVSDIIIDTVKTKQVFIQAKL